MSHLKKSIYKSWLKKPTKKTRWYRLTQARKLLHEIRSKREKSKIDYVIDDELIVTCLPTIERKWVKKKIFIRIINEKMYCRDY